MTGIIADCARPGMVLERFPLHPLATAAGADGVGDLARAVGVSSRTIHRWARNDIPFYAADRAAIALGSHPLIVWPDQWQHALNACDALTVDATTEVR